MQVFSPVILFVLLIGLQIAAAVFALSLVRTADRKLIWFLIFLAMVLMALRRIVSFVSMLAHGTTVTFEFTEYMGLMVSLFVLTGLIGIRAHFRTIRMTKEALEESQARFRATFEQAAVGIAHVSTDGRWQRVNQKLCDIVGYTREELMNKTFQDITHPDDLDTDLDNVRKVLAGEISTYSMEKRYFHKDGSLVWVKLTVSLVRDSLEQPKYFISVVEDITASKQAEEELKAYREHLEELVKARTSELEAINRELEGFSYSISHDLRAPLRYINGFVELLTKKSHASLDDKSRHYLQVISDSARQMGRLIDDILSFVRMGKAEMLNTRMSLDKIIAEAMSTLSSETDGRVIAWKVNPLPDINGDPAMIGTVIVNLLSNAIKFTRPRPEAEIEIGVLPPKKDEDVFYVRDNGVGFDMKYSDKLFNLFQRLHGTEEFEGTGLGLANVRRIIHRHGGRTWAEGTLNEGATFYFSLPKHKTERGGHS